MAKRGRKSKAELERIALIKEAESLEPIKVGDSKTVIDEKLQKTTSVLNKIFTTDAFTNQMARLGFGQPNLNEGAAYPLTRLTQNYQMWNSVYRSSWIARKIIDVVPSDMLKNWITIRSSANPDCISKIEKTIRHTKTKEKIKEALRWARLYGGSAALILIDNQDEQLDEPLDLDILTPDSYKGLLVLDRWSGIYPSSELIEDINDPDFGLPKYYMINASESNKFAANGTENVNSIKVHHSRILRFEGRALPYWEKIAEMYWGESELEIVYEELKKRDNTSANIAGMIFLANIRVLKMNDLGQLLGAGSEKAQENLYNVIEAQNRLMNNMGIYVMDKDDDFDIHNYSFGGLDEIYQSFMLDVAGAAEMPVTKLFGREPSGFNSTGESDLKQYYDTITEKQEDHLLPVIDKLLPIITMSSLGAVPDDLDWDFNPVFQISNKDMADLAQSYETPVLEAFQAGLITKEIALKELKQHSEITGMWTTIDDEYIDQVSNQEKEEKAVYSQEEENRFSDELEDEDDKNINEEPKPSSDGQSDRSEDILIDTLKKRVMQND